MNIQANRNAARPTKIWHKKKVKKIGLKIIIITEYNETRAESYNHMINTK